MKKLTNLGKLCLIIGCLMFWISLKLPMNTSLSGLNNAGVPYDGSLNLFYSIISILILPLAIFDYKETAFWGVTILTAGVGICNLLMIFSVPFFLYLKEIKRYIQYAAIACAIYVCTGGTVVSWHFYPIRYGHYFWCLSFIIVALGVIIKFKNQNDFS